MEGEKLGLKEERKKGDERKRGSKIKCEGDTGRR